MKKRGRWRQREKVRNRVKEGERGRKSQAEIDQLDIHTRGVARHKYMWKH